MTINARLPCLPACRRCMVTSQQLWDSMTVEQYVQVVGSTNPDPELVRQLTATGKRVGRWRSCSCACACFSLWLGWEPL